MKNPGIAAVLSFFVTGLGQIYNGKIIEGFGLMCVQFISVLFISVGIGLITTPLLWVYGIWEAYHTAEKINEEQAQAK